MAGCVGHSGGFAAGDTFIVQDLLQGKDAEITIDDVLAEVPLGPLFHDNGQVLNRPGAFVAAPIEGSSPSTRPYLRCPSSIGVVPLDEGPIMRKLRLAASEAAGVAFNHAKVQLYETRANKIDFHADKVLDMCEDDAFVSFRLGAKRVFSLRSKAYPKVMHNIPATSNSAIVVGPRTNREWTHGVLPDKRREEQCAKEELACGERSLSIIFRRAVTFWRSDGLLFGAGAKFKTEEDLEVALQASRVQGTTVEQLGTPQQQLHKNILEAWGRDNKSWTATREKLYGPIIEGSVMWVRTSEMEAPLASSPASPSSTVADAAHPAKRPGAGIGKHLLVWILLGWALCFSGTLVSKPVSS